MEKWLKEHWVWAGIVLLLLLLPALFFMSKNLIVSTWSMPLNGKVIVLDAGHGGADGGAVSESGLIEKDITLQMVFYLRDYLQEAGALVYLTRESDRDLASPDTGRLRSRKAEDLMRRP